MMTAPIILRKINIFPGFERVEQFLMRALCMVMESVLRRNVSRYLGVPLPTWEEFYGPRSVATERTVTPGYGFGLLWHTGSRLCT